MFSSINRSPGPKELWVRGADISFTLQEEAVNRTVTDNGEALPVEQILARHGANYARLRVWVDPPAGTSDVGAALTLATRTHGAGMKLLLDLHFSDTWADRHFQQTPAAWANLGTDALQATVEGYTRETVAAFARQGTPVDIVQIGNEVTNGFLWPADLPERRRTLGGIHRSAEGRNQGREGSHSGPGSRRHDPYRHRRRGGRFDLFL